MSFLSREDFKIFEKYGGQYADDYPEAHQLLRTVYDKLGEITDVISKYGYECRIRRNPRNQGGKYEEYHWAQIYPRQCEDTIDTIYFVASLDKKGYQLHIDCNYKKNKINKQSECYQSWYLIPVDEVCLLSKEEIIGRSVDYLKNNFLSFLHFGALYDIKSCINLLNMEKYISLLKSNKNLILTGAPGTGKTYLAKHIAEQLGATGERYGFVQFHPSLDYTDFVEGLRPVWDNQSKSIAFERKDGIFMAFCREALKAYKTAENKSEAPKYVFVIDEINRGEISKIFGELFFAIDPGYRGPKGKVSTQYSNLWTEKDWFDGEEKKFYIPENVYIIGTMNNIDRSVECMDFAMRRRFAFKEVLATDRFSMIEEDKVLRPFALEIQKRMDSLNSCILKIRELSTAYQIGAAYYLKLKNYVSTDGKLTDDSWNCLWNNHLHGLLFEYLRGQSKASENLEILRKAFFFENANQVPKQ